MNALIVILIIIIVILIIVIPIVYLCLRHTAKSLKESLWDSQGYTTTKQLSTLYIDEYKKAWYVIGCNRVYHYSEILDFSVNENGIKYKSNGGVLRAAVGGATFGLTGAVIGATTASRTSTVNSLTVEIIVNDPSAPLITMYLLTNETKTTSFLYRDALSMAHQITAQLTYMQTVNQNQSNTPLTFQSSSTSYNSQHSINTKIVGVTKINDKGISIQLILPNLSEDSDLMLVREPNNPYDKNAIKVIADYQHIGYIKSDLAQTLAPIMDQGKIVNVKLLQVTGGGDKAYGCNIQLFI